MEWNGMRQSIKVHAHMVYTIWYIAYEKFLVCGAVSLGYCQGGDGFRGLEHSFAQGTRLVFIYY